ncbi:hypothetical protein [Natronosalvus vescus]|uniref:hypothetical protein n=1 Tax=Natronosalvus vescus TaxID=2953881 RepID=UPI002091502B|nr:hypothetical protein [Natronosalvus vescus]
MFVNYYANPRFHSSLNVAVARLILGITLLWKIVSYDWKAISSWPDGTPTAAPNKTIEAFHVFHIEILHDQLHLLSWLAIIFLVCFIIGYQLKWSSFLSSMIVFYLMANVYFFNSVGETETVFIVIYFVLLIGLYDEHDMLTIDALREAGENKRSRLEGWYSDATSHTFPQLKWALVIFSTLYFMPGLAKLLTGPGHKWVQPETLARFITHRSEFYTSTEVVLVPWIMEYDIFLFGMAFGTIFLQIGFLLAVLLRRNISFFALGLIGMHIMIALTMQILFIMNIILILCFVDWERAYQTFRNHKEQERYFDRLWFGSSEYRE